MNVFIKVKEEVTKQVKENLDAFVFAERITDDSGSRTLLFFQKSKTYEMKSLSLNGLLRQLQDSRLVRISKNGVVNVDYVVELHSNFIVLQDGNRRQEMKLGKAPIYMEEIKSKLGVFLKSD
jgi:hypothetical protein